MSDYIRLAGWHPPGCRCEHCWARNNPRREENTMSTKDQLEAMRAEIESHVENLRQLRKSAMMGDAPDALLDEYSETIKFMGWIARNLDRLAEAQAEKSWPEPDGLRYGDGRVVPTSR